MKKCPQCGREYDASMSFCLDDGAELLYGPATGDEPATAILRETAPQREAATRAQIHQTGETSTGPAGGGPGVDKRSGLNKRLLAPFLIIAMVVIGGLLGYRYFTSVRDSQISSIAVLPFTNATGNADSEYLSDGLAESLIYRLSQFSELKVSPRGAVSRYKGKDSDPEQVGNELGVDAVMTGRLVQRGDNLTISVDLVDVRNKKTLWGEQFERKMSDLLATHRDMAATIAEKLQLKLGGNDAKDTSKPYTNNNEAYQLYLQGRYFWNKRTTANLSKATELFKTATEKDPNFALAYAGLADCYVVSYYYIGERPRDILPLARTYAAKAIELDPKLAEPHATLGLATWFLDWDKAASEKHFQRAIELDPNYATAHHWYSRVLRGVGQLDEAWKEINRAVELEPLSLIFLNNRAEMQIERGEMDHATATCQKIIDLDPNFWASHQTLGIIHIMQDRSSEALVEAQKSVELSSRSNAALALLGHVYGRMGNRSDADAIIKELEQRQAKRAADGRDIAIAYMGMKDHDKAFEWLERAFQERSVFMAFLNLEPLFEPLKNDPRWADLKRRVGLPV